MPILFTKRNLCKYRERGRERERERERRRRRRRRRKERGKKRLEICRPHEICRQVYNIFRDVQEYTHFYIPICSVPNTVDYPI